MGVDFKGKKLISSDDEVAPGKTIEAYGFMDFNRRRTHALRWNFGDISWKNHLVCVFKFYLRIKEIPPMVNPSNGKNDGFTGWFCSKNSDAVFSTVNKFFEKICLLYTSDAADE